MKRNQLQKMYEELSIWVDATIGDDILNKAMRPEYQEFVEEQRGKGVQDADIPQQVLWAIREKLKSMPKEEDKKMEVKECALPENIPSVPAGKVVIHVGSVRIEVFA